MFERILQRVGETLSDEGRRRKCLARILGLSRGILLAISVIYGVSLFSLVAAFALIGERNLTLAFLLYLPRAAFLIPMAPVVPLALLFHRPSLGVLLLSAAGFVVFGMGYQPRISKPLPASDVSNRLTVLTYNRGQHANQSLQPFKNLANPDLIALQESGGRAARYAKAAGYGDLPHTAGIGEFTLLSRHPILSTHRVEVTSGDRTTTPAARFEIDFSGRPVALYNVHVISPRDTLNYYRRGAFLYGVIGVPGTDWGKKRLINQPFWDRRIDEARELVRIIAADPLPTLVVGDFNAPAGGYVHGILLDQLADAHREAGSGFGFSFPGVTRNPLSRGGPWMRIDYLFSDKKHWRTEWCLTEPDRPSQHRAVAAQFRLLETAGAPAPP